MSGSLVAVTRTGSSTLSVINLVAKLRRVLVNVGGLGPAGPRIPLSVVGDTRLTFTRPIGVDEGPAVVEVLNPPFTPFSTSGSDPDGAFTYPAPDTRLTFVRPAGALAGPARRSSRCSTRRSSRLRRAAATRTVRSRCRSGAAAGERVRASSSMRESEVPNVSSAGVLLESTTRLLPGRRYVLRIGPAAGLRVHEDEVVRCALTRVTPAGQAIYRAALRFDAVLSLE